LPAESINFGDLQKRSRRRKLAENRRKSRAAAVFVDFIQF
jgi:hypothetical protein